MTTTEERYLEAKRALFEKVYGSKLNPEQCRAVFQAQGPLLVLAGAGSGKTTVLVNRIQYLIRYGNAYHDEKVPAGVTEESVEDLRTALQMPVEDIERYVLPEFATDPCPPWAVLAITFTNKAANEIKERLAATLGGPEISGEIWAGTFHSICVRILRRFGESVGYRSGFTIYDTDDKKRLVSDTMKKLNIDEKTLAVRTVCNEISACKDALIPPSEYKVEPKMPRTRDIARIYDAYQKKLMECNAMDFDDIIMKTVELLLSDEEARSYYQSRFRYVLVDEYQDTNVAQFRLTQLLSDRYRNVMVVGDDDQSIYRFRGATVENILSFDRTYPDATVVKLEQNYRSTKNILAAANAVIAHNRTRHEKTLWCAAKQGDRIRIYQALDQADEARYITDTITSCVVREKCRYRDFAVLYRVNELARSLEAGFAKSGIPYRVLGGQRFYDRKEIRDIVAYLYLILNPSDDQRLKRIINEPKRKIGAATVDAVELMAGKVGVSMFELMRRSDSYPALSRACEKLKAFTGLIEGLREEELRPSQLIQSVFVRTGYKAMLEEEGEVSKPRIDSVEEFVSAAVEYESRNEEDPTLAGFLEEVALVSDVDKYDQDADAVVLMTIHSAKGLEFPQVFLAGMEEGVFPGMQSIMNPGELDEERRLAYVAITRAKQRLYIVHTRERTLYGRTAQNLLSRFIREEIPEDLLEQDACRNRFSPPGTYMHASGGGMPRPTPSRTPLQRPADIRQRRPATAALRRFEEGSRVHHAVFGDGTVLSCRDMGGDLLYEVAFDSGDVKKLMATYAKLTPTTDPF